MSVTQELSVSDAAQALGVAPAAVRKRIAQGSLPAVKRGRDWWLDVDDVARLRRQSVRAGRPLSASMAWAVLLLASGEPTAAEQTAQHDRGWLRARRWLDDHSLAADASSLRARARREMFDLHPSEVGRVVGRSDTLMTGVSAGAVVGLVGDPDRAEVYAAAGSRDALLADHALEQGKGPLVVRWVDDAVWSSLVPGYHGRAPRAAVLVDLLESDDPRARREAAEALGT